MLFCSLLGLKAQSNFVVLSGVVTDDLDQPLESSSVLIEYINSNENNIFIKTNSVGRFELNVIKNSQLKVSASYLRLDKKTIELSVGSDSEVVNFKLSTSIDIEEITIDYKYEPIVIKKDTIVFDLKAFKDGSERKLEDVLKKLPGLEVRNGNVSFQGKAINTTKVENKPFFGGNTKLAIENIPSDAVTKIELISHFTEIDFMKEIHSSDDIAMNVELSETHKKIIFGDVQAAAGSNDALKINSALFSFNPSRNFQAIIDWNTIGQSALSISDLMQFQAAPKYLIGRNNFNTAGLSSLLKVNRDHKKMAQHFGGISYQKDWKSKLNLSMYGIVSHTKATDLTENNLNYLLFDKNLTELRKLQDDPRNLNGFLDLKLDYRPSLTEIFNFKIGLQFKREKGNSNLQSFLQQEDVFSQIRKNELGANVNSSINWTKKISAKKAIESYYDVQYNTGPMSRFLLFDNFQFKSLLPLSTTDDVNIEQSQKLHQLRATAHAQYHYIINRYHQFSPVISLDYFSINLDDKYLLGETDAKTDLTSFGFGNMLNISQNKLLFGVQYKLILGKITMKLLPSFHIIRQRLEDVNFENKKTEMLFTPKANFEYAFTNSTRMDLQYEKSFGLPNLRQLNESYEMSSFNTLFQGTSELGTEHVNNLTLSFRDIKPKNRMMWLLASYSIKANSYQNSVSNSDIEQLIKTDIINTPDKKLSGNLFFERTLGLITPLISSVASYSSYIQYLNEGKYNTGISNVSFKMGVRFKKENWPTLLTSYQKGFQLYKGFSQSKFLRDEIELDLSYLIKEDWTLKSNYTYLNNKNDLQSISSNYSILDVSLDYKLKNKGWTIGVIGRNLLNNRSIITTSQNSYLFTEQFIYTLPRQVLLSVQYKI